MCETFKWIKLLVVDSQKYSLQIPVKISLDKWLWATWELFKVRQKCKYLTIRRQISIYGLDVYFSMRRMTWPIISWNRHRSGNFDNVLTLFVVKGRSEADLTCFWSISHHSSYIKQKFASVYTRLTSDVNRLLSTYYWSNTMNLWPSFCAYEHHCI